MGEQAAKYFSYELLLLHSSMNSSLVSVPIGVVVGKRDAFELSMGNITGGDGVGGMKFTGGEPSFSV